jgi:hypothetical protein
MIASVTAAPHVALAIHWLSSKHWRLDMANPTPGPWVVSPFRAQVICDKFGRDGDFLPVAQMLWPTTERTEAETYANGHLIAAAPDLLEVLLLLDRHGHTEAVWQQARAAIAKARGEA